MRRTRPQSAGSCACRAHLDDIARTTGFFDGAGAYRAVKNYFGSVPVMDHDMQRQIARERVEFLQRKALEQVDLSPTPANIRAAVETLAVRRLWTARRCPEGGD
jgi:hypothetical protein